MYRHQQYESRVVEYHEDAPFFREAVTLIDQCTKLLKDDRISLRNKIKDYLRALRENRVSDNQEEMEHFKQIVQIFVEANKKKSLSKIHKGDRVMDWLQIKLRKFIDQNKKQRHRKQLQHFRKGKFVDNKKHPQPTKEKAVAAKNRLDHQHILGISRITNQQNSSSYTRNLLQPSSLSRSRERSPIQTSRKSSQSQSYAQYSYHKNFSFLKKGKDATQDTKEDNKRVFDQKCLSRAKRIDKQVKRMNRSVDQLSKINNCTFLSKNKNISCKGTTFNKGLSGYELKRVDEKLRNRFEPQTKQKVQQKPQISQLTKLFTQQLNSGPTLNNKFVEQPFLNPTFNFQVLQHDKSTRYQENTDRDQPNISTNWSGYEESTKKIQSMLEGSRQLFEQISKNTHFEAMPITDKRQQIPNTFNAEKNSDEGIFTPPDFLAECRRLINSSNKKPAFEQSQWRDNIQAGISNPTKLTFNNILSESRDKKSDQVNRFGQFGLNEVTSENASVNISTKKPESEVQFQFKNISIHSVEELLLEIFSIWPTVRLDRYQIGQIMSKCNSDVQKLFQQYCDLLTQQQDGTSFYFKFVAMLKFFYSYGKIFKEADNHFSNFLCSILDMRKNGFVDKEAVEEFLESMEGSGIQVLLLQDIRCLLSSVFRRCCEIQGGGAIVTRWSFFYLELKRDSQFQTLNQVLSRFQFQVDSEQ